MKLILKTIAQIHHNPKYLFLAFSVSFLMLALSAWLPNLSLVKQTIFSSNFTLFQKIKLLTALFASLSTNFTSLSRTLTIIISVLFGANVSLLVFYLKKQFALAKSTGMSIGGLLSGLVGIGCAACGSVLFTQLFGIATATSLIAILPLKGQEFSFLSIALLTISIYTVAKKIQHPIVCATK